jgi:6-phosphogluconolactonase (cycloisomerase 2 family)
VKTLIKLVVGTGLALGLTASFAPIAGAQALDSHAPWGRSARVVYVQTDNTTGNQVVAYDRAGNGSLTYAASYATDGYGGALNGAKVDFLASQGSLSFDPAAGLLLAVNAGSNSISVFTVDHGGLTLRQVVGSGGTFPNSIATDGNLVYVLNARNGGSVSGFRVFGNHLFAIPNSTRALGLTTPTGMTEFTNTPGQVAFTPDGSQLVVTTKATTSAIDVFSVGWDGRLSASPTVNVEAGAVPFSVAFDWAGRLVVADAGTTSAVSTFWLHADGTLTSISTVDTGQPATCWIAQAQGYFFASNAGGPNLSTVVDGHHGELSLLGNPTTTDPGTVDAAATPDGQFLYVQTGLHGIVDEFSVDADGTLTGIGSVTVTGATGGEGIVAL